MNKKRKKSDGDYPYAQKLTKTIKSTNSWFDHEVYETKTCGNIITSKYENKSILRCRPVELYPSPKQKKILLDWMSLLRKVYNTGVRYCRKNKPVTYPHKFRDIILPTLSKKLQEQLKSTKVFKHCINETICDVAKAYKTCFSLIKGKHIKHFRIRYKKASKPKQSFPLPATAFKKTNGFCIRALGVMKSSHPINKDAVKKQSRLVYKDGKFILWVPQTRKAYIMSGRKDEVALDPGLRTFQTTYDGTNCMKYGNTSYTKLRHYIRKINNTKRIAKKPKIKRLHRKLFTKISNLVDDMHWKVAKELVTNYDTIYIGKLSTKGVVSKKGNLSKICKQPLILLKHFRFRMRLLEKGVEYNSKVVCVNEAYTSQACGKCGTKNKKLGGAKVYTCSDKSCDFVYDRDFNGARNILRKAHGIKIC